MCYLTPSVQLEGCVAGVNTHGDGAHGGGRLLEVVFTSGLDVLVGRFSGSNVRGLKVAFSVLEEKRK